MRHQLARRGDGRYFLQYAAKLFGLPSPVSASESDSKSEQPFSGLGETSCEEPEMGDEKPGDLSEGGSFEVSGEASASAEPGEGALDDPAPGQELEAFDAERLLDDLDAPRPAMGECVDQLLAAIDSIGKDLPQLGKAISDTLQQGHRTMDVLNIGGVNVDGEQKTIGIGDDVPLASIDALTGIEAARSAGLRRCRAIQYLLVMDRPDIDFKQDGMFRLRLPQHDVLLHLDDGLVLLLKRKPTQIGDLGLDFAVNRCPQEIGLKHTAQNR